jgi:NAD(P)-dependent dehydrogenase (short-subunit alcohol dehydrogenase family)
MSDAELFTDQVAVLTGGAGGLGSAIANRLAKEGAHVVIVDRDAKRFSDLEAQLREHGHESLFIQLDPGKWEDAQEVTRLSMEKFGRIDILVNCTGVAKAEPFLESTPENWQSHINSHLDAFFYSMRSIAPEMVSRGYGRIVNLASVAGLMGPIDLIAYGAAKTGIIGLTRAVSFELADHGITVNAIAPGPIETPLLLSAWSKEALEARAQHLPIARLGTPEDIANAASFLARPESSFITGITVPVDGGSVAAGAYMVERYRRRTSESSNSG